MLKYNITIIKKIFKTFYVYEYNRLFSKFLNLIFEEFQIFWSAQCFYVQIICDETTRVAADNNPAACRIFDSAQYAVTVCMILNSSN